MRLIQASGSQPTDDRLKDLVHEQIQSDLAEEAISTTFNVMFLYDDLAVARSDADQLYRVSSMGAEPPSKRWRGRR